MKTRWPCLLALLVLLVLPIAAQSEDDDDAEMTREEIRLGRDATKQFERQVHLTTSGPTVERMRGIVKRLGRASGRPLPYSVKLVEDAQVNAITFPGGFIYLFRGILDQGLDDAMLANVLAHEVIHGARSHGYRRLLQMQALGTITGGQDSLVSGMTKVLLLSGVGRTYENQADRLGMRLAAQAGFDPRGMLRTMQMLKRVGDNRPGLLSGLVATHPPTTDRIKKVQAELKAMGKQP